MKPQIKSTALSIAASLCLGVCALGAQESAQAAYLDTQASINATTSAPYESPFITSVAEQDILEIEAVGIGVAPSESCSPAQAVALAKRAAIIDAYRHLGEQMYGIKLNANDTVQNMVLKNSSIKTKLNALIRGAKVRESACEQGICQVTMELKLDGKVWSQVLGI